MAAQSPAIAEIALQLEAAAAQIHVLSTLPGAERFEYIKQAIEDVKAQVETVKNEVSAIDGKIDKMRSDFELHRTVTTKYNTKVEAWVHNERMRTANKRVTDTNAGLAALYDLRTNKPIHNFPLTANGFHQLDRSTCDRICCALDWAAPSLSLRDQQNFLIDQTGFGGTID
ncbi:hypothetical protein PTNB73_02881 [Pyrenophora teres f. teres]|uniref:Uncharacterized protein n=1 Tax=Pyrenophora teres f. teres TaxID=97479 RepID=A0A6S6W3B4_9PLEO|nr:hypothetical protein PTNB29_02935 [Pyrenophora teres f. teres]KAE8871422.1 hypothetical protein PTNB73_02881 [Pyrenophora teres f. teres]CAE7175692.1 hypothetical protein PTTW11_05860 [Pyrenophora teres f. teres]